MGMKIMDNFVQLLCVFYREYIQLLEKLKSTKGIRKNKALKKSYDNGIKPKAKLIFNI